MMGDTRRFLASRQAMRHTGLDVTVYSSDGKRAPGHLAKQGPPLLRWALYEAACLAAHTRAPDHDFYAGVKDRIDHKRAAISVACKIARRSHHILRELGDQAYATACARTRRGCDGHAHRHLMRPRPASRREPVALREWATLKERSGRTPRGDTPSIIMSPGQHHPVRAPR